MTHHDKETRDKGTASKEQKDAEEKGVRDQRDVNQGAAQVTPVPDKGDTLELPEKLAEALEKEGEKETGGKGVKPKVSTKGHSELAKIRDQTTCGFCGVNMRFGGQPLVVPVKGKKIPKDAKGQYRFRSPGAESEGTLAGVLCELCARNAAVSPGAVDIKTVIAIERDGTVVNLPVKNLQ
jgi:hypothetical protein